MASAYPVFERDAAADVMIGTLGAVMTLFAPIASAATETAIIAYLDPEWRVLGVRHMPSKHRDEATIPLRDILADALAFDCVAAVLAHNHPRGDPSPSAADYALTRRLARALEVIGVRLVDHVILARGGRESFRELGLL